MMTIKAFSFLLKGCFATGISIDEVEYIQEELPDLNNEEYHDVE